VLAVRLVTAHDAERCRPEECPNFGASSRGSVGERARRGVGETDRAGELGTTTPLGGPLRCCECHGLQAKQMARVVYYGRVFGDAEQASGLMSG
jgi:hypothetical protein